MQVKSVPFLPLTHEAQDTGRAREVGDEGDGLTDDGPAHRARDVPHLLGGAPWSQPEEACTRHCEGYKHRSSEDGHGGYWKWLSAFRYMFRTYRRSMSGDYIPTTRFVSKSMIPRGHQYLCSLLSSSLHAREPFGVSSVSLLSCFVILTLLKLLSICLVFFPLCFLHLIVVFARMETRTALDRPWDQKATYVIAADH